MTFGGGREVKWSNIIKFRLQSQFQRFFSILCVCSHKRKIENIFDRIFILSPGSCPRGRTLGRLGCPGGQQQKIKHGHVAYQINGDELGSAWGSKTLVWGFTMAPHRLRILVSFVMLNNEKCHIWDVIVRKYLITLSVHFYSVEDRSCM